MNPLPRLFIDTLELTIAVEERAQVQERLEYAGERWQGNLTDLEARGRHMGRYRYRYKLTTPNGSVINIRAHPTSPTANYLKLEYSPEKIGPEGAAFLRDYLSDVLGANHYREAYYQGRVNRLDATFDVRRVSIHNYWIEDKRSSMSSAFIRGDQCQLETVYLGYKTRRQLCIYDKTAEIESRNQTVSTSIPWVRFEYRYSKGDYPLGELYRRMKNPYGNFVVRRYATLPHLMPDFQARLLFDACRMRGRMGVLNSVPEEDREATETAIKAFPYAPMWQRRLALWAQLRDRIEELLPAVSAPSA